MRLIDADALLKRLDRYRTYETMNGKNKAYGKGICDAMKCIERMITEQEEQKLGHLIYKKGYIKDENNDTSTVQKEEPDYKEYIPIKWLRNTAKNSTLVFGIVADYLEKIWIDCHEMILSNPYFKGNDCTEEGICTRCLKENGEHQEGL